MKAILADRLIDANGIRENPVLLVEGQRITDIGKKGEFAVPEGAEVVDAAGLTLLPGLIDCHLHLYGVDKMGGGIPSEPVEVRLFRAVNHHCKQITDSGFTTVQDAGSMVGLMARNAINSGFAQGPRIKACGRAISQTAGHSDAPSIPVEYAKDPHLIRGFDGFLADGVPECLRGVRECLRMQADFIKICTGGGGGGVVDPWYVTQFNLEEIKAVVGAAHDYRRKVMSHVYAVDSIKRTVLGGVDIVTHGNMMDDDCVKLMREHGTTFVPTMNVYERFNRNRPSGGGMSTLYENQFKAVRKAWEAGVPLALGTDNMGFETLPHGGSALELELYVEKVGVPAMEALKIGTINGAKVIGMENDLGTIEKGKLADIIAVKGDVLEDIKLLQDHANVKLVMREGKALKSLL
jgi:imidazolonepropionase-like amidohydrolase